MILPDARKQYIIGAYLIVDFSWTNKNPLSLLTQLNVLHAQG